MDEQQATIIFNELIENLQSNGYGEIVRMIDVRYEEQLSEEQFLGDFSFSQKLRFYLQNGIQILRALSVSQLPDTIATINKYITGNKLILNDIQVELADGNTYSLSQLPDYSQVIQLFQFIQDHQLG